MQGCSRFEEEEEEEGGDLTRWMGTMPLRRSFLGVEEEEGLGEDVGSRGRRDASSGRAIESRQAGREINKRWRGVVREGDVYV